MIDMLTYILNAWACSMTANSIVREDKLCYAVCQHAKAISHNCIAMYRVEVPDATDCRAHVARSYMWLCKDLGLPLAGALHFEKRGDSRRLGMQRQ